MLKKIRVILALILFTCVTLLFLDFTGTLHTWLGWTAKIQLVPAILAMNVSVVIALVLVTLVFGRIYCSVICPLGIFQDVVSKIASKRKKNRFSYSSAISWLRYPLLALFILALVLGISSVYTLLEPYSAYGRIVSNLFAPIYQWSNNTLAYLAERTDSYAFYSTDVWIKNIIVLAIAIGTFTAIIVLAWRNGRTYCNTICPVGTFLGVLSKFSFLKPMIDKEKCSRCGLCARNCKASCIDATTTSIDHSRCVTCMNCIKRCKKGAITYTSRRSFATKDVQLATDQNSVIERRRFLSVTTLLATSAILKAQDGDGGLAIIEEKKMPKRSTRIVPPGAISIKNMEQHCTACQLCVSVCPNQILCPSNSLDKFMQPEMSFERGYCRPECIKCSEVCPTSAINKITKADKSGLQIGHAIWIKEKCIVIRDEVSCINCERHCPTGAIILVELDINNPKSLKVPVVDTERCIGCGACENLCPARPHSAIYVEGHERHRVI